MISINIFGSSLDLYPDTSVEFILNSPLFVGGDITKVSGSYTLPINVPLTSANKKTLRYPSRVDNAALQIYDEPCQIYFQGKPLFQGLATIQSSSKSTKSKYARLYVLIESFTEIKNLKLNELDLGVHEFADLAAILAHAKDTALNPLTHTHAFFPVANSLMTQDITFPDGTPDDLEGKKFINYYDVATDSFVSDPLQRSAAPFIRLDYILEKIAEATGLSFENLFQNTDELKSLYVYNDVSIYDEDFEDDDPTLGPHWNLDFDLSDHVPNLSVSEWLKRISRWFCIALLPDVKQGKLELISLKDIITAPHSADWSAYLSDEIGSSTPMDFPSSLGYESSKDEMFTRFPFLNYYSFTISGVPDEVDTRDDADTPGWYYVNSINYYLQRLSGGASARKFGRSKKMMRQISLNENGQPFLFSSSPLFMTTTKLSETITYVPEARTAPGTNDEIRLMFYRGLQSDADGNTYPFASNTIYDPKEDVIPGAQQSLLWNGPHGMFENHWKEWANFLQNKKNVKTSLNLPIREILNMKWKNKVSIRNNQYLVKQLRVILTNQGLKPCPAELVTVL